ncbi:peptide chain release factor N(5)-glutamine methyltransferase, partial [Candidatus Falkowbacteria bacterium]|nr:peptide chain release factor N(5)-glutamine methyltransferase [Candidatus Falkowbacteria bacterium]
QYSNKRTSARLDAEVILSFVINKPKEFLYTYPEFELTKSQEKKFKELVKRRAKGEPVAYLIGKKEFYGREFFINKDVLVPRPETEVIVETVLDSCLRRNDERKSRNDGDKIVAEIGTGSSCLATTLAKEIPEIKIIATDICEKALKVAKRNAKEHKVLSKIKFYKGSLLEPIKNKRINILVANLPYGWQEWKNNCSMETVGLKFEPAKALFTDEKGLKLYRELLEQIANKKHQPKLILFEIDPRQKDTIKKLIKKILPNSKITFIKDLAYKTRVVKIENH